MKKILLLTGLLVLLVTNAKADNDSHITRTVNDSSYFTMGVNDTLLIHPQNLGSTYNYHVNAHFVNRYDSWTVQLTMPNGLTFNNALRCDPVTFATGMNVPYVASDGTNSTLEAVLTDNDTSVVFSSTISELGYWDPDNNGNYVSYGTVKWEPGDYYPMFTIYLDINYYYREGYIYFNNTMTATYDSRGETNDTTSCRSVFVKVGYRIGDANGDGNIDSSDVAALNNYVLGRTVPDEFQADAGDINRDGELGADDVAILIRWLLGIQSLDDLDM